MSSCNNIEQHSHPKIFLYNYNDKGKLRYGNAFTAQTDPYMFIAQYLYFTLLSYFLVCHLGFIF